jgi:hypothetical protein
MSYFGILLRLIIRPQCLQVSCVVGPIQPYFVVACLGFHFDISLIETPRHDDTENKAQTPCIRKIIQFSCGDYVNINDVLPITMGMWMASEQLARKEFCTLICVRAAD